MAEIDTKELRELAEAATPGPWVRGKTGAEQIMLIGRGGDGDYVCHVTVQQIGGGVVAALMKPRREASAHYIAAVNPQAILSLLDRHDAQAARIKELEDALRPFAGDPKAKSLMELYGHLTRADAERACAALAAKEDGGSTPQPPRD